MNTFLMHLHIPFLIRFIFTVWKITCVFTKASWGFFFTFSSFQVLDVVSSKLSVIIETLLAFLTSVILYVVVNYLNMLVKIGEIFVTNVTIFSARTLCSVRCQHVTVQRRLLIESFTTMI